MAGIRNPIFDHILKHKKMTKKEIIEYYTDTIEDVYKKINGLYDNGTVDFEVKKGTSYVARYKGLVTTRQNEYNLKCPECDKTFAKCEYKFLKEIKSNIPEEYKIKFGGEEEFVCPVHSLGYKLKWSIKSLPEPTEFTPQGERIATK